MLEKTLEQPAKRNALSERMRRGEIMSDKCPSRGVLEHATSRWGVLVLIALQDHGTLRFSELRRTVRGVSERMLAKTLQALQADGFVLRKSYDVVPPHVEYSLTPMGRELSAKVSSLAEWIEENIGRVMAARAEG